MNTNITSIKRSIIDLVNSFDNTARIAALRTVCNHTASKSIGAIRQDIRDRKRTERDPENDQNALDQRNFIDENSRGKNDIAKAMGFGVDVTPLQQASLYHAIYSACKVDLDTIANSRYDEAMSVELLLEFMTKNARPLDYKLVKELSRIIGCTPEVVAQMHELNERREREQLVEATPEIIATFNGFGDNGYTDADLELPAVAQHQMAVKIVEGLTKAKGNLLQRVLRSRRMDQLGDVAFYDAAQDEVIKWVTQFEELHRDELNEAIEAGRNLRSVEDVLAIAA